MTVSIYTIVIQITIHYDSDLPTYMVVVDILVQGRDVTAGAL